VKSNTAFVRKIKTFPDGLSNQQKEGLTKEISALNCSRYLDEIIDGMTRMDYSAATGSSGPAGGSALASASSTTPSTTTLKEISNEDLGVIISLSVILFTRYESFLPQFLQKINLSASSLHFRDKLKILMSVFLIGLSPKAGEKAYEMLKDLIEKEGPKSSEVMNTVHTLIMFVEYFGNFIFDPNKDLEQCNAEKENGEDISESTNTTDQDEQEDISNSPLTGIHDIVPEKARRKFTSLISEYLEKLFKRLAHGISKLNEIQEAMHKATSDTSTAGDGEKEIEAYSKARKSWLKFYDLTSQIASNLHIDIPKDVKGKADEMLQVLRGIQQAKEAEEEADRNREEFDDDYTRSFYRALPDINTLMGESPKPNQQQQDEAQAEGEESKSSQDSFDALLANLGKIYGRASFEQWIRDFAPYNNKRNRKKVAQQMFQVKRTSLEMLPHYARLVKIFFPEYPDMAQTLCTQLLEEFDHLFTEKDQIKIESKVKNIRFIGELTKFLLIPVHTTLNLLNRCLSDFTHHNINVACTLLETCGRFLLLHSESRKRMQAYIAQLKRMRDVMTFSDSYELMIENAIYTVNTEATANYSGAQRAKLPPVHRYILHLLYNQLNKKNAPHITKKLQKLNWKSEETMPMLLDVLQDVRMARYDNIHMVAAIVADMSKFFPEFGVVVIDRLIEDMRAALAGEIELSNQRRILDVKFFGELFVFQCFEYQLAIDMLYMLIRYAPHTDDKHDTFRIRLVCTLLDTCWRYFITIPARKQRDRFIVYLQDYVLRKDNRLPVDVEFMLADTLDAINKNLRWPKNKSESQKRINRLERMRPIPMPSEDRLFPITKNPVTSEDYDFDDEEFDKIMNFEEEKEKQLKQQINTERTLEDLKFEREVQQLVQQDATERRMQRKPVQMESVQELMQKVQQGEKRPGVINMGGKKVFVMRRRQ